GAVQVTGDCSAFGCWCSTAGGTEPHCVMSLCVDGPDTIPWAHDICWQGERYHCDAQGGIVAAHCPGNQTCVPTPQPHCAGEGTPGSCPPSGQADICLDEGTIAHCSGGQVVSSGSCAMYGAYCVDDALETRCVFSLCPPVGKTKICLDDHLIADCDDGALGASGDCSAFGCWCSTAGNTEAHCVLALCVDSPDQIPVPHDICFDGKRYHCDGSGTAQELPLAAELCNAADDDCDGSADEGFGIGTACSTTAGSCTAWGELVCTLDGTGTVCSAPAPEGSPETCNGADDDCDGVADEGFSLGTPCVLGSGGCAAAGVMACAADGTGIVCDAEPLPLATETCNGLDDDCDGEPDNGFDVGVPCSEGEGLCLTGGTIQCQADGTAACSATPISCDDGDPCTSDTCDPSMGCRNEPLPGCCTTDAQCGAGKHCQDGQCVCGALGPATCQGDQLVAVDECGTMVVLETCAEGCAAAACCPPGTHADEDDCLPTVVGEDTAGGADTADADTTVAGEIGSGEGRAEADSDGSGFRIEAGPGSTPPAAGGGCTSGAPMPSAWLVSLASLLLLLGGSLSARIFSRGFRRPPGRA
ncbi:MAG: hypothetical protein FJ098_06205, partial [Deltaproteobacteria bacterium]|nr:hypothetical protein [Deltaproteobacteria bacterium]